MLGEYRLPYICDNLAGTNGKKSSPWKKQGQLHPCMCSAAYRGPCVPEWEDGGLTWGSCMAILNGLEKNCHWKNRVTVISQITETQFSVSNSSYVSRGQVWVWDSGLFVGVRGWWIPGFYFLQYFMDRKIFLRNNLEFQEKKSFFFSPQHPIWIQQIEKCRHSTRFCCQNTERKVVKWEFRE